MPANLPPSPNRHPDPFVIYDLQRWDIESVVAPQQAYLEDVSHLMQMPEYAAARAQYPPEQQVAPELRQRYIARACMKLEGDALNIRRHCDGLHRVSGASIDYLSRIVGVYMPPRITRDYISFLTDAYDRRFRYMQTIRIAAQHNVSIGHVLYWQHLIHSNQVPPDIRHEKGLYRILQLRDSYQQDHTQH